MFSIQEANCVVDVSDTEINESRNIMYCLKDKSRANLRNGTVVVTDQMVSKWGASASKLYLFDGATAYFSKVDDDANRANAGIVLEGGSLSLNLTNHVAEGRCLLYDRRQITTRKLGTVTTWYRVVDETEAFAPGTPYEVVADRICYSTLGNAVALVPNGANLRLLKDVNLGDSRLTLARDKDMHHTFDLGGHTVSGNDGFFAPLGNVVISNGTFKVAQGGTKTVIYLTQNDSHVYFAPSVTIDASIDSTCLAFVYDGKNSTFICDGCTILGKLYSVWNTGNIATSRLILTNDVTFAGSPIGHRERTDTTVRFYGGAYSSNPSAFLGENCAIYHTNTISTLPYFVTPFARQTFNFDKPLEERIFTSKPSGAVQVELVFTGAYDRKKSYRLADFSAVDGFENLTFSLAEDSLRPRMSLSYNNGKLTSHPLGMTLIFR